MCLAWRQCEELSLGFDGGGDSRILQEKYLENTMEMDGSQLDTLIQPQITGDVDSYVCQ